VWLNFYGNKICVFQRLGRNLHQDHHHPLLTLAVHHQHCHTPHTPRECPFPMEPHQLPLTQLTCLRSFLPATTPMLQHHTLSKVSLTLSSSVVCHECHLVPVLLCVPWYTVISVVLLSTAICAVILRWSTCYCKWHIFVLATLRFSQWCSWICRQVFWFVMLRCWVSGLISYRTVVPWKHQKLHTTTQHHFWEALIL